MAYRDDREALEYRVRELEAENRELREQLARERARRRSALEARDERRARKVRGACVACGGTLLPVAMFAGHDVASPLPLGISTLRFGDPKGGFTHFAPVRSLACASCGFIHAFIDMERDEDPEAREPPAGEEPSAGPEDGGA